MVQHLSYLSYILDLLIVLKVLFLFLFLFFGGKHKAVSFVMLSCMEFLALEFSSSLLSRSKLDQFFYPLQIFIFISG